MSKLRPQNARVSLQAFFSSKFYHTFISAVILLNCLVLRLDTSEFIKASGAKWLEIIDKACLAVFVVELGLKIYAFKLAFFTGKDRGWNAFDFIIVAVSLFGASGSSVLRALRVFRALRLLSVLPQMPCNRSYAAYLAELAWCGCFALYLLLCVCGALCQSLWG